MSEAVKSCEFELLGEKHRFEVWNDPHPENPREADNLGTMLYQSNRYILGDERIFQSSFDDYLESAQLSADEIVSLPLYLLDHSGLKMSVDSFNDPWDSGCVGVIFCTHEKIKREYKVQEVTEDVVEKVLQMLRNEVEEFSQYLEGDVYGFRLLKEKENQWNEEESGWNFYGDNILENGMLDYLSENVAEEIKNQLTSAPRRSNRL